MFLPGAKVATPGGCASSRLIRLHRLQAHACAREVECAAVCLNHDGYRASNGLADGATCVHFLTSVQKGCVLKVNQGKV